MKVLIYSPKFYPSVGGLENLTLMLAKEFLAQGHEVKVVCFETGNGIPCGVETYYSPSALQQVRLYWWSNVFYMPNISLKGLWLRLLNPFKPWAISHNGWYGPFNSGAGKGLNERVKLFLLRFAKNISVSKAIANYIPAKSSVIANCYDEAVFHEKYPVTRTGNVLFVGRLVSDKGVDVLVNACTILWEKGIDFKLSIIGTGEMKNWIESVVQDRQLANKVIMRGKVIGKELAGEMNSHKILAVPSTWHEPFGIVALEGLACGCKVVCSTGGGLPEAVGPFGSLFSNGNVPELASILETAIQEEYKPDKRQLGQFLEMHSVSTVARQYLNIFKS